MRNHKTLQFVLAAGCLAFAPVAALGYADVVRVLVSAVRA
jgi:hypothetical protein